jgi:Cytochrome b(C-terminal)/b6/petD
MLFASADPSAALESIAGGLGIFYLLLASMNAVCALYLWRRKDEPGQALVWVAVAVVYVIMAPLAMSGNPEWVPKMPHWVVDLSGWLSGKTGAIVYSLGTTIALVTMFLARRFFVRPMVAWSMLNLALLAMGLSVTVASETGEMNFMKIVTKPDNVPIVALVFLLGYFTWLATAKAVKNDDRLRQGLPPLEKLDDEKVLVWPDLVYTELICMIAVTALLLVWGIMLKAPLEYAASSVLTPNPSKAPWYFLGLQEMLVYFDPWYAGVVLPSLVIFGLMAIPFLDYNKLGSGYYTINQRKFAYLVFQFGFLELWITLIILGTFLRGPNWNFFGPFENWDPHKVEVLNNRDLSQLFWIDLLGKALPRAPSGSGFLTEALTILQREAPGIIALAAYFILLPPLMATTIFRKAFVKLGFFRYMLMSNLFLFMLTLPLKMVLRWTINLKYVVHIDEWFLNF